MVISSPAADRPAFRLQSYYATACRMPIKISKIPVVASSTRNARSTDAPRRRTKAKTRFRASTVPTATTESVSATPIIMAPAKTSPASGMPYDSDRNIAKSVSGQGKAGNGADHHAFVGRVWPVAKRTQQQPNTDDRQKPATENFKGGRAAGAAERSIDQERRRERQDHRRKNMNESQNA